MVASPVLNHHHRDVIRPCASVRPLPHDGGPGGQTTLPFKRLQEEGLIDLDDTLFPYRLVARHGFQGSGDATKGGVFTDSAADGSLSDGQPVDEGLGIVFPALCLAKSASGVLVRTELVRRHCFAAIATQSSTPAPGSQLRGLGLAVRATLARGSWVANEVMG